MQVNTVPRLIEKQGGNLQFDIIGKTFVNNKGNEYIVTNVGAKGNYGECLYLVRFPATGYEVFAPSSQIRKGDVKDRLSPSVHGVGCLGYAKGTQENERVYHCWRAMIARCYNEKNPSYKTYGAKGCKVCDRWLRFDLFLQDISMIDGYDAEEVYNGNLCLDKDIKNPNSKLYCVENCTWVTRAENTSESATRNWKLFKNSKV